MNLLRRVLRNQCPKCTYDEQFEVEGAYPRGPQTAGGTFVYRCPECECVFEVEERPVSVEILEEGRWDSLPRLQ